MALAATHPQPVWFRPNLTHSVHQPVGPVAPRSPRPFTQPRGRSVNPVDPYGRHPYGPDPEPVDLNKILASVPLPHWAQDRYLYPTVKNVRLPARRRIGNHIPTERVASMLATTGLAALLVTAGLEAGERTGMWQTARERASLVWGQPVHSSQVASGQQVLIKGSDTIYTLHHDPQGRTLRDADGTNVDVPSTLYRVEHKIPVLGAVAALIAKLAALAAATVAAMWIFRQL